MSEKPKSDPMSNISRKDAWKMFDAISPTYDKVNRILSLGMDQRWRRELVKHLPPGKNLKILDLATGTGDQARALLETGASIVGIDLSSEMLEIGKKKLGDKVQFLRADAENPPFPDHHFDAASFSFGIRNVTSPLTSLKAIRRVLKPKGRALILEFSLPPLPIRGFYLFYLRHILPGLGGLLSKKPSAYRYLNETIEEFPSGKDFCFLMKEAGFTQIREVPMALGAVTLYTGDKS
jgi:demethylmenaquinone methyltransferase/2-methoxy-6-polyprenyl-1,4-benzoquinol methylase